MFTFCQRWLVVMCALSVVIGALLVVAGATPLFAAYNQSAANAFWDGKPLEGAALSHHLWALSLTGAGTMGWAVTLGFVAAVPFRKKEPWAWWCMTSSVLLWVAVDVAASAWWGVHGEVAFVTSAGLGLLVPLALTRRFFRAA